MQITRAMRGARRAARLRQLGLLALVLALIAAGCTPAAQPAAPAAGGDAAAPQAETTAAPAEEAQAATDSDVFTYWGGLIFSDVANQMLVDRINQWGQEKGIQTDVVMINQNETVQRVSAAIEAGTLPDALDVGRGFMLLLTQSDQLEPLDDLYAEIDAQVDFLPLAEQAVNPELYGGNIYGIPMSLGGDVLFRRADLLEAAGYSEAPQTWEEVGEMARAINDPPNLYGLGLALSNVGDGNRMTTILQSWGGRIADDEGKTCTLDSPETRAFLEWVTAAYQDGLFPPDATTWDGAGDNVAYQSGTAGFITNPGSVYLYMKDNDPDLAAGTKYSALPAGPAMRLAPAEVNWMRVIPKTSKHKELALDLFKYLADEAFIEEYYANAIYGPSAQLYVDAPIFSESEVHKGLLDLALNGTFGGYPDVDNAAFSEYQTNFLTPRMIQRMVIDGLSADEAIAETQEACQAIYDKYNAEQ
jgi:multiple sugar transport system substrate-binding protein